ncbi:MAG: hypothetical protein EOR30_11520 [Mesorhizobium sp.]|nr:MULTISPECIES: hypothetical protein [unclassified Mesorhizobium]RUV70746.1 hypothetical protein EOA78_19440 [Mesorhizobium sp. M5C.F.Cr.IN.023.01.1.1]RWF88576.1 MAG: hypothetical protein EOQ36_07980 [Mesorhizobium sp.]RWF95080.1 MAG: hypothetical protein EOQ45_09115 [Mesorhizobium sp.]RWI44077.1 MAG: hypothetical protein EOR15_28445 [Mesorhizobium sp.]RWI61447.1 MAG: hypothetical protein EOR16_00305 [Mesorhizobium sp.]
MVNNTLRQESGAVPRRIAIDSIRHMGSDSGKVLPNAGKRPNVAPITVMAAVAATGTGMEAEVTEAAKPAKHSRLLRQCPNSGQRNRAADRQAGAMIENWGGASGRKQPNI